MNKQTNKHYIFVQEEQWETIEPEVTKGDQDVYIVKYEIKNLDGGNYETRLRSENVHGWSEYSPVMSFESGT